MSFEDADAFYATLVHALEPLDKDEAFRFLCRLALILANEIGRHEVLQAALEEAAAARPPRQEDSAERSSS
jgi:hypothetical protein